MVRFGKKAALLAMAGVLTAASVTGCSGSIDAEATVVTVGKEKVPLGVVNFYARMMQGQYETYYAGMMGTTAEELWTQDAGDDKTYEESVKDSVMEAVEKMRKKRFKKRRSSLIKITRMSQKRRFPVTEKISKNIWSL